MNTTIEDVKQYFDQFGKVSVVVRVVETSLCGGNERRSISNIAPNENEGYFCQL